MKSRTIGNVVLVYDPGEQDTSGASRSNYFAFRFTDIELKTKEVAA